LAGDTVQVVHIANPVGDFTAAADALATAQSTAQGRARIALVAALADVPGWFDPTSAAPSPLDFATQEINQAFWLYEQDFPFAFAERAVIEETAGGNPSFNHDVNYKEQLQKSVDYAEVRALYTAAGLDLDTDLMTLNNAPRINADPAALTYMRDNVTYNGMISIPELTLHTTNDGLVTVQNEQAYSEVVKKAGDDELLRQTFVNRPGHCEFSPAETITALNALESRLSKGKWPNLSLSKLNAEATALGSSLNVIEYGNWVPAAPAFETYSPAQFLRIYDAFTSHH
jgi:hypothetical protein